MLNVDNIEYLLKMDEFSKNCLEANRLETFDSSWPYGEDTCCSKENMAKAGFYSMQEFDTVRCFVCHLSCQSWDPKTDNPWTKHLELSPSCIFAQIAKEEAKLTVEQWCDILCGRTTNLLDYKLNKILKQAKQIMN